MYKKNLILGLIPARSGSKGIPLKNIAKLGGRPLLSWVAEESAKCPELDEIIISTDDPAYAKIACKYGVGYPFIRPSELAQDTSLVIDVILHALTWYKKNQGKDFDYVCLCQPTACFTLAEDYTNAIKKAVDSDADTVISVEKCDQRHPSIMFTLDSNGKADWLMKDDGSRRMLRRQDLPPIYLRAGNAYVFKSETIIKKNSLYGGSLYAVEIPMERTLDIDSPFDLKMANALLSQGNK